MGTMPIVSVKKAFIVTAKEEKQLNNEFLIKFSLC
jgi:hypothetical protein